MQGGAALGSLALLVLLAAAAVAAPPGPSGTTSAAAGVAGDSARIAPAAGDSLARPDSLAADSAARAAAAPPRDLVAEVRANFTPENRAYAHSRVVLDFVAPLYTVLVALLILFSGLSARMRTVASGLGRSRYLRVLAYLAMFSLLLFALDLPLAWYGGYALEHQYGLSTQTLGAWFGDELKGLGFVFLFLGVVPLIALAYGAIEKFPRVWWLALGLGAVPVLVSAMLISPIVIEPAFNRFTPLHDAELRRGILDLAARAGIPARKVYEVDKSTQTHTINAYVSGFGASQRIVLWDTTLRAMKPDEILFVMGHEMGHYVLGHIWKGIAFFSLFGFGVFFVLQQLARAALRSLGPAWQIRELHDVASLPLLMATLTVVLFVTQPVVNQFSRAEEHEADVFGLEVTRTNEAAARAFVKLGAENRSDPEPSPFVRAMLYDHPPLVERVQFALDYRPWETGRPARFFHGPVPAPPENR